MCPSFNPDKKKKIGTYNECHDSKRLKPTIFEPPVLKMKLTLKWTQKETENSLFTQIFTLKQRLSAGLRIDR